MTVFLTTSQSRAVPRIELPSTRAADNLSAFFGGQLVHSPQYNDPMLERQAFSVFFLIVAAIFPLKYLSKIRFAASIPSPAMISGCQARSVGKEGKREKSSATVGF